MVDDTLGTFQSPAFSTAQNDFFVSPFKEVTSDGRVYKLLAEAIQDKNNNPDVAPLLWDNKWGNDSKQGNNSVPEVVSFSFPLEGGIYLPYGGSQPNSILKFSTNQKDAAKHALQRYADVADINFVDKGTLSAAIRYGNTSAPATAEATTDPGYGEAYQPGPTAPEPKIVDGDVWIFRSYAEQSPDVVKPAKDWQPGTKGQYLILHETGHALGLKHPHEGIYTNANINSVENTVMSIKPFVAGSGQDTLPFYLDPTTPIYIYPTTPMPYDIAALQFIYGVNWGHNVEDTTYKFDGKTQFYETIWDAGGTDTIDFSAATTNTYISLLNGNLTTKDATGKTVSKTSEIFGTGGTHKLLIAFEPGDAPPVDKPNANALIENAIGGSGKDFLEGNKAGNLLVAASGSGSGPVPTIVNGSFEGGNYAKTSSDDFATLPSAQAQLTGWSVQQTVDWVQSLWTAADGSKSIDLSGDNAGAVSQSIDGLVKGLSYRVAFDLSGDFFDGTGVKNGKLSIDGQEYLFDFARPDDWRVDNMGWVDKAFTFTFRGLDNVLKFESLENSFFGPVIDNVRFEPLSDNDRAKLAAGSGGNDTLVGGGGDDVLVVSPTLDRIWGSYKNPDVRDNAQSDGNDIFMITADSLQPYPTEHNKQENTVIHGFGHHSRVDLDPTTGKQIFPYGNGDKIDLSGLDAHRTGDWQLVHPGDALKPGTIRVVDPGWKWDGYPASLLQGLDSKGNYFQMFIVDGSANERDYGVRDFVGVTSNFSDLL